MRADPWSRRRFAAATLGACVLPGIAPAQSSDEARVAELLREGGVAFAMRHARAPGTFDPPGFSLGDCSTQRNLDEEGRAQARRIGAWFNTQALKPSRVRSSPWCRCVDTAWLAFGSVEPWPALGSPRGNSERSNRQQLERLGAALRAAAARPGVFEVWVTHMFVLSDFAAANTTSGEGLVLRAGREPGSVDVLARLALA